jgi:5-methyltetrahydrofolate--homocysteine methyltransferase
MNSIRQLECAIVKGDIKKATALTEKCLREGLHPALIIEKGILRGMEIVGEKWKTYEYFIPNVLVSAMAIKLCLSTPSYPEDHRKPAHGKGRGRNRERRCP